MCACACSCVCVRVCVDLSRDPGHGPPRAHNRDQAPTPPGPIYMYVHIYIHIYMYSHVYQHAKRLAKCRVYMYIEAVCYIFNVCTFVCVHVYQHAKSMYMCVRTQHGSRNVGSVSCI